ncbi:MAG: hypothetical protein WEB58_16820 [Planctomycetaceae bacterium]
MLRYLLVLSFVLWTGTPSFGDEPPRGQEVLTNASIWVAGQESDNIVRFDLSSGESTVIARLSNGSRPRALAANGTGQVFVGLLGNQKNVVKLVPSRPQFPSSPLVAVDVTPTISRFGPGSMAFDRNGILHIAGNSERRVLRYNVETGAALEPLLTGRQVNILGLAIHDESVFVAEYFQKIVMRIDTAASPVHSAMLLHDEELLNRPYGMTFGHSDNLFVSSLLDDRVVEVNPQTGEVVGVFMDVKTIGARGVNDLNYSRELGHYFLTSGDTVYEIAGNGSLIARFTSPALSSAWSTLVFVSPPASTAPAAAPVSELPIVPAPDASPAITPLPVIPMPVNESIILPDEEDEPVEAERTGPQAQRRAFDAKISLQLIRKMSGRPDVSQTQ